MPIYKERDDKLELIVDNSDNMVKIKVDCYNGTLISLSYDNGNIRTVHCGETEEIGDAEDLKIKSPIEFVGSASNPDGEKIKVEISIFDDDDHSISYTFPDDYTGSPEYDDNDENPTYRFFVNFS